MLKEIYKYDNIGKPDEICYILKHILSTNETNINDIIVYCLHNLPFLHINAEAILSFLKFIKIIESDDYRVSLTCIGRNIINQSQDNDGYLCKLIICEIMNCLKENEENTFLDFRKIKYDVNVGVYISNSNIPLKFAGLRNLLIAMQFFVVNPLNVNILQINDEYIDCLKDYIKIFKKKVTMKKLKKSLEIREAIGLEAELYVLEFEFKRLKGMKPKEQIIHISEIDVTAGYDIASFNTYSELEHNRFIEVKSYKGEVGFYWSKNEVEIARIKKDEYFIYLVDRDRLSEDNYVPTIIKNPYTEVYKNEVWVKESQSLYIYKL